MSLLDSIKSAFGFDDSAELFYQNAEVVKIEWWLSWCHLYPDLFWARLRVFSNGKADVLFQDDYKVLGFDDENSASNFVSEDEFSRFDNLDKDDKSDLEIPDNALIEIPSWGNQKVRNFKYIGKY